MFKVQKHRAQSMGRGADQVKAEVEKKVKKVRSLRFKMFRVEKGNW